MEDRPIALQTPGPDRSMHQDKRGEIRGMYTYSPDTNAAMIDWCAVPLANKNANG
jgi:hypothetical protein